eukprot:COSAG02_NODE_4121_length_5748_cov_4.624358_3_plen_179_part_00
MYICTVRGVVKQGHACTRSTPARARTRRPHTTVRLQTPFLTGPSCAASLGGALGCAAGAPRSVWGFWGLLGAFGGYLGTAVMGGHGAPRIYVPKKKGKKKRALLVGPRRSEWGRRNNDMHRGNKHSNPGANSDVLDPAPAPVREMANFSLIWRSRGRILTHSMHADLISDDGSSRKLV